MEERNLINGYHLLEQDLKEILTFIEPTQNNYTTYSHRLYALYVRACMEFEANCKMIFADKNYKLPSRPNINDYHDIHTYEEFKTINGYIIKLQMSEVIILSPLKGWSKSASPRWYREYNDVKHSRLLNFSKANLLNVLNSIAAIFILLHARYGIAVFTQHQENRSHEIDDEYFQFKENSLFKIKPV